MRPPKPAYREVIKVNIPYELRERSQWGLWRPQWKTDRWAKVPYQVNGRSASVTNPAHWSDFDTVLATYQQSNGRYSGIGFVLTKDDPFTALDLDKCIDSEGNCDEQVEAIIREMNSYAEYSPSGTGIRIFIKASLPPGSRNRKGQFEVYSQDRYVTVTGHRIEGVTE